MSALYFTAIGIAGLAAHWLKRWAQEETQCSLWEYFFVRDKRATVNTLLTFGAAMFSFVAVEPQLSWQTAYAAFLTGYATNSVFNSDKEGA